MATGKLMQRARGGWGVAGEQLLAGYRRVDNAFQGACARMNSVLAAFLSDLTSWVSGLYASLRGRAQRVPLVYKLSLLITILVVTCMTLLGSLIVQQQTRLFEEQINELLPQTQCGQCGYPGCRPYAEAIANNGEAINKCPPGGEAGIQALATLLDACLNGIGHAGIDFIRIVPQFKGDRHLAGVGDFLLGNNYGRHILFGYVHQFDLNSGIRRQRDALPEADRNRECFHLGHDPRWCRDQQSD